MSIHFSNPTRVQIWRTGILSQTQRLSSIFRRDALIHYRQVMIHPYGRFPKWFLSLFSILLLFLTGCGRYSMHEIRIAFAEGKFDEALTHLDKASSKTALPYLFERGLLAHYGDHFEESNQALERAELLAEDLYTKSISREVAALLTSDNVRPYPGTRYERLLVHYYRALNYVYMNLPDDALVECRRAGQLLQYYADEDPTYNFAGAAFFAYLSGILYEWTGDWNDAYIAYRWAEAGYQRYEEQLGVSPPEDVGYALVRLAWLLGFNEEAERYAQLYGEPPLPAPGSGEFILIYESGFVPQKAEENLFFPIFKTDRFVHEEENEEEDEDEEEIWEFADEVMGRQDLQYDEVDLEYLLRVAIPVYMSNRPRLVGVEVQVEPRFHGDNRDGNGAQISTDEIGVQSEIGKIPEHRAEMESIEARGVLVEDVEGTALVTFEAEQKTILLRTVARALLKYLAHRGAKEKADFLGDLVNFLNVVTERADTRSWETLPNQIFLVRMPLPPGTHDVTLSFLDEANGLVRTETLRDVKIYENGKTFLNYRTFE